MSEFVSGFACFVGRPNAGKSTLINALVGQKVAITSSKPQTTRRVVRGIVTTQEAQLIIIDTPGLSKPRSLLQTRLNDLVYETWSEVDVVAVVLPANQHVGPGDEFLVAELAKLRRRPKLVAIVTKTDLVSKERLAKQLIEADELAKKTGVEFEHIVPCSAISGEQIGDVAGVLTSMLEPGPKFYPDDDLTDQPDETLAAEIIREAALEDVRDELPHSIAVEIEEMRMRPDRPADKPIMDIYASMIVERESQKGIMIGKGGSRIKQVGVEARRQLKAIFGTPVYLDLKVKVLKDWQKDSKHLNRLGF